jgi:hypothetical protein
VRAGTHGRLFLRPGWLRPGGNREAPLRLRYEGALVCGRPLAAAAPTGALAMRALDGDQRRMLRKALAGVA